MNKLWGCFLALMLGVAIAQDAVGVWTIEPYEEDGVNRSFMYTPDLTTGVGALYFRCSPESEVGVEMFLYAQMPIGAAAQYVVGYELEGEPKQWAMWFPSSDQTAVFAEGFEVEVFGLPVVVRGLDRVEFVVVLESGVERPYSFGLGGFGEALGALGCYWGAVPVG